MKHIFSFFFLLTIVIFCAANTYSQNVNEEELDKAWSRIKLDPNNIAVQDKNYIFTPTPQYQFYRFGTKEAIVSPNYRIKPSSSSTQSEMSIDIHPTNSNIIFAGSNGTSWNGSSASSVYGTGAYWTTNSGTNWNGSDNPSTLFGSTNSGDPAAVIAPNGNFYMGFIRNGGGQGVAVSSNNGSTWTSYIAGADPSGFNDLLDKNHLWVDKHETSPFKNRVYDAWTHFVATSSSNNQVVINYSTNNAASWSTFVNLSGSLSPGSHAQGVNISSGPNGEVYAAFAIYDNWGTGVYGEDAIGFAKSTNGGMTWTSSRIYSASNFGIRGNLKPTSIRVASFPSMAVDRSGGPYNGYIYIVWPQRGVAPAGSDPDIVLIRSTNGGNSWSSPIRVNNDALNNGKDQYFPWCTVDQSNGLLHIVFYDNRHTTNDSSGVWMASSFDGGINFENYKVSDANFRPKPISGLASGYQGDYIGIVAANGKAYPLWADDRTGNYQAWITEVIIADYPLNPFNLVSPPSGVTISSFPNSSNTASFNWDTASSVASYKWIFGNNSNPRILTLNSGTNSLSLNLGSLDNLLANLGLLPGDSIVGEWDVWAYRNNAPIFDSLKSSNGPSPITLKRGIPQLIPFSLLNPPNNTNIITSTFNNSNILINWRKSGDGVTYKWKFGTNVITNPVLVYNSANSGYDTTLTFQNSGLDLILGGIGLAPGDSIQGEWAVWAYNGIDSLKSNETFSLKLKRQAKGDILVVYDSTSTNGIASRDSVVNYLSSQNITFDLFNKQGQTSTKVMTFRGYKILIWLGQGTSVMSVVQKDSVKAYLNNPPAGQKSKLIIFSEDIGYQFGRNSSTYYDVNFMNQYLGANYVLDRPTSGANQGLVGAYINAGLKDSTVGTWPDVLSRFDPSTTHELYKFRSDNSINAIGKIAPNFNVATFGVDIRSLRRAVDSQAGSPVPRFLSAALLYVNTNGTLQQNYTLNLKAFIEGFYNNGSMISDTVTAELRTSTSPFSLVESKQLVLNSLGEGSATFSSVTDASNYYIVIKHRNALETWSKLPQQFLNNTLNYDFTVSSLQAYGDNLKLKEGVWTIFSGDVNQDGAINIFDDVEIYNDSYLNQYRLITDINLDGAIDIFDDLIAYNNSYLGIVSKSPNNNKFNIEN